MNRRLLVTLGSGALVSGYVGSVSALSGRSLRFVAVATCLACGLGLAVGYRLVTDGRLTAFVGRKRLILLSAVPLFALIGWWSVDGFTAGLGPRYGVAMAAIYLALVGWVVLLQVGQNAESDAARERGETLVTLPTTDLVGILGVERYRRPVTALGWTAGLLMLGWFVWLAVTESDPLFLVFAAPVALGFLPGTTYVVHVTEEGLVSENYLGSSVSIGTKFTAWDEITGYEVEGDTLTINTQLGPNFTYDTDEVDDVERVRSLLDSYVSEQ